MPGARLGAGDAASAGNRGSVRSVCQGGKIFADKGRFPCHLGSKTTFCAFYVPRWQRRKAETAMAKKQNQKNYQFLVINIIFANDLRDENRIGGRQDYFETDRD